ncbi:MAG: DUF3450 domain-containing protein [Desulfatitalea sp.]
MPTPRRILTWIVLLLLWTPPALRSETDDVSTRIERPVQEAIATRQATQREEEQWRDAKEKLLARYEALEQENEQLRSQKETMRAATATARERIAAKDKQLADIQQIAERIEPFLDETMAELRQLLTQGPPFLIAERRQRLENLETIHHDPDIAISEKYRKVMEALLVEAEYGFTIEVYQQTVRVDNQEVIVDILRLGRLALFFLTLDRGQCGFYNEAAGAWQPLPATHRETIANAVDIGAKRKPPELLNMPLGRMVPR